MIEIIPAISIYGNKIARLHDGNVNNISFYEETPLDLAKRFEDSGIRRINLIDLEGSEKGKITNIHVLERIAGYTNLSIDFGGGITTDDYLRSAFEYGATAVHAASIAAKDTELFSSWIISFGRNKIILSTDSLNGKIVTKGWSKNTDIDVFELIKLYHDNGILYLKSTDISVDDTLKGPSIDHYNKILNLFPSLKVMASGGISSIEQIEKLQDIGVYGVIFAKAFYEGKIKLKDIEKFLI
jgi:phosphoribosylformimino-5-aminoimidazole carboxamide ribotide isomerase